MDELIRYIRKNETEAEATVRRERELSTKHVIIDLLHCCLFDDGDFDLGSTLSFDVFSTHPATKEQRVIFFQKMHEAGYEWDSEKKELRHLHVLQRV